MSADGGLTWCILNASTLTASNLYFVIVSCLVEQFSYQKQCLHLLSCHVIHITSPIAITSPQIHIYAIHNVTAYLCFNHQVKWHHSYYFPISYYTILYSTTQVQHRTRSHEYNYAWLKTCKNVGIVTVLITSLYPMIGGVKTRNQNGCHTHFLLSLLIISNCTHASECDIVLG